MIVFCFECENCGTVYTEKELRSFYEPDIIVTRMDSLNDKELSNEVISNKYNTLKELQRGLCPTCNKLTTYKKVKTEESTMTDNEEKKEVTKEAPKELTEAEQLAALDMGGGYIKIPQGSEVEVTVKSYTQQPVKKLPDGKTIEFKANNEGTGNYFALKDNEGKELSVSAWALHKVLSKAFVEAKKIEGLKIKIFHPARGEYSVEVLE